jgi:hypothetical protein
MEFELNRVFNEFKSVEYVTTAHRSATIAKYGQDLVTTQCIVIPFREKKAPDGTTTRYTAKHPIRRPSPLLHPRQRL